MTLIELVQKLLDPASLRDDIFFREALNTVLRDTETTAIDLAAALSVSKTVVLRWADGTSIPHDLMRKPVFRVLLRSIELPR